MNTDKHGLNTEVRDCVFSLSANGVGGEGGVRWCVENSNPLTLSLAPLGRGEGNRTYSARRFYPCPSACIPLSLCFSATSRGLILPGEAFGNAGTAGHARDSV